MKNRGLDFCLRCLRHVRIHRLLRPRCGGIGLILVLHRVLPPTTAPRIAANARLEITPQFLEHLIRFFLDLEYEVVSLDTVHDRLVHPSSAVRPFVCFTFDDGYVDAHDVIHPLFRQYRLPFAVYVITDFPDRQAVLWWYMLEELVLRHDEVRVSYRGQTLSCGAAGPEDKEMAFGTIRDLILSVPAEEQQECIEAIFAPYGIHADQYADQQMTWQQVTRLARDPLVTIGAHTVHHYRLNRLPPAQVRWEIDTSRQRLEEKLDQEIRHFAYPYGSRDEAGAREFALAAESGFHTMTTVREGCIFPAHRDYLQCLPRVEITGRHQELTLVDLRRCGVVALLRNRMQPFVTL
jgi:peptidoglycan/xylan/chitin deacetylase (PgdA/CDA1 family)